MDWGKDVEEFLFCSFQLRVWFLHMWRSFSVVSLSILWTNSLIWGTGQQFPLGNPFSSLHPVVSLLPLQLYYLYYLCSCLFGNITFVLDYQHGRGFDFYEVCFNYTVKDFILWTGASPCPSLLIIMLNTSNSFFVFTVT